MGNAKLFLCSALIAGAIVGPAASKPDMDQNQVSARASLGEDLSTLTRQYYLSSDRERPNIAREVARLLRASGEGVSDPATRVRALLVVSQNAAFDRRKDLALSTARQASGVAQPTGDAALKAQSSIALARALILQEDYVEAVRTMASARLAYGPMTENRDPLWDELAMYEAMSIVALPPRLQSSGQREALSPGQRLMLTGERGQRCGPDGASIVRIDNVGLNPFSNSLHAVVDNAHAGASSTQIAGDSALRTNGPFDYLDLRVTAGIAVRSDIDEAGNVTRSSVTAYAPLQYLVAAANKAAPTWKYNMPQRLDASCRNQVLTVVAFKAR
jgi:hypothetical protein